MRSHWIGWVSNAITGVTIREGRRKYRATDTNREEGLVRMETEGNDMATSQCQCHGLKTMIKDSYPEVEEDDRLESLLENEEGTSPANILILNFWPPEL